MALLRPLAVHVASPCAVRLVRSVASPRRVAAPPLPPPPAGRLLSLLAPASGPARDRLAGLPPGVAAAARSVAAALAAAGVPYAVAGAVACHAHGHARSTADVDVLINREDLPHLRAALVGLGWSPRYAGARRALRDAALGVDVDVLVSGDFPGAGQPKPVAFPRVAALAAAAPMPTAAAAAPARALAGGRRARELEEVPEDAGGGVAVLPLVPLVEIKLASGASAPHRRKDFADVQALITANALPLAFADELHGSVKADFARLWLEVDDARKRGLPA